MYDENEEVEYALRKYNNQIILKLSEKQMDQCEEIRNNF